jgi:hypothetical protein
MEGEDDSSPEAIQHSSNESTRPRVGNFRTKRFNQLVLNDLIRDLSLSYDKAELLASTFMESNLSQSDVRVCHYRIWNNVLKTHFRVDGPTVFCQDINGLFKGLNRNTTHQIGGFSSALRSEA